MYCTLLIEVLVTSVLVLFYLADRVVCEIHTVVCTFLIELLVISYWLCYTLLIEVLVTSVLVVLYLADRGACDIRTGCTVPC